MHAVKCANRHGASRGDTGASNVTEVMVEDSVVAWLAFSAGPPSAGGRGVLNRLSDQPRDILQPRIEQVQLR